MKIFFRQSVCFVLTLLLLGGVLAAEGVEVPIDPTVRVGLFWGDDALPAANLLNSTGVGYRFGYFDGDEVFWQVGYTGETALTLLKTQNMYLSGDAYTDVPTGERAVGCYHLQLPSAYATFEEAVAAAGAVSGAFPAWVNGGYCVRVGGYLNGESAAAAQANLGIAGTSIAGTSNNGVSVVKTGTTQILFQFDGGPSISLGVRPGLDDAQKNSTWFKKYQYCGGFQYQRVGGGNLTVSNVIGLEDYTRGVLPYEMSNTWPLEALKAQAVCARTYALFNMQKCKHAASGFDLCNTTDCQVYRGVNSANATTNQAVDETFGKYARYGDTLAQTYYYSHNGGATEDVRNVWGGSEDLPYLKGVIDPYEAAVVDKIPGYYWSKTYTKAELTALLRASGRACADVVDLRVSAVSPTGNALAVTFTDAAGKSWSIQRDKARSFFGLRSLRYTISGGGKYFVDGDSAYLGTMSGVWATDGSGNTAQIDATAMPYVITDTGTAQMVVAGDTFTISGSGWGHNIGMSQWGAYSMAQQGFSYDQILTFYYTGIEIR